MAKRFWGIPYTWKWPGWSAIFWNLWNRRKDAVLFPAKRWGVGWTLNFAYPLNRSRPLWKRLLGFLLGLLFLLLVVYLIVLVGVIIYYFLTPDVPGFIVIR